MIKTYILLIVLAIIVGLAWRAKYGLYQEQPKKIAVSPTVANTPTPQASPSATPTISIINLASNSAKKIYVQPTIVPTKTFSR